MSPSRWEMGFVRGGEEAMAELERSAWDVIVTDMRMPGIDGATLLRHVQVRHPRVVRIVLSGPDGVRRFVRQRKRSVGPPDPLGEGELT